MPDTYDIHMIRYIDDDVMDDMERLLDTTADEYERLDHTRSREVKLLLPFDMYMVVQAYAADPHDELGPEEKPELGVFVYDRNEEPLLDCRTIDQNYFLLDLIDFDVEDEGELYHLHVSTRRRSSQAQRLATSHGYLSVLELSESQRLQLKQRLLTERDDTMRQVTTCDELANADELVSDHEFACQFRGVCFTPDDFFD